ncbi:hypothetical protein FKW77_007598 [Venturia effusa]|uniref:Uncharacterized protein n=1 Tax=Venturia effusa TaxID=50376 RepID=A0A517LB77_9PEZI|nr:hypothetical protein FKW77_007598 [Venturia effusa]
MKEQYDPESEHDEIGKQKMIKGVDAQLMEGRKNEATAAKTGRNNEVQLPNLYIQLSLGGNMGQALQRNTWDRMTRKQLLFAAAKCRALLTDLAQKAMTTVRNMHREQLQCAEKSPLCHTALAAMFDPKLRAEEVTSNRDLAEDVFKPSYHMYDDYS